MSRSESLVQDSDIVDVFKNIPPIILLKYVNQAHPNVFPVPLDYSYMPRHRYGYDKPPHRALQQIFSKGNGLYEEQLKSIFAYVDKLSAISFEETCEKEPYFNNGWFSGLDAISLYGLILKYSPKRYVEIGSGNSTKFARKAIVDGNLATTITSIDPYPRAEMDMICDLVIREPIEDVDLSFFGELEAGDFLFIDNSHRAFSNSDVTVCFLDILPYLKPGVFVHFHDIFLPDDYPPEWRYRYYSEQYLLAMYLLAEGDKVEVVLPNAYIAQTQGLREIILPLIKQLTQEESFAGSFWMRTC